MFRYQVVPFSKYRLMEENLMAVRMSGRILGLQ